jgi:hypothetical protein
MGKKRNVISKILSIIGGLTVLYLIVVLFAFLIDYFVFANIMVFKEASRITSPDGKVDAVDMHSHAGAATRYKEMVYVVPAGQVISKTDFRRNKRIPVFKSYYSEGKKIHWVRDKRLEIQYETAEVLAFRNSVSPFSQDVNYEVEIRQTPLRESSLPSY